jgi:predicted transcriptional regulator
VGAAAECYRPSHSNGVSWPRPLARGRAIRPHFGVSTRHVTPSAAKQLLREALDQVPDDATVEEVMERLYFLAKVAGGLDAAERGDVLPHDEIEREFLAGE